MEDLDDLDESMDIEDQKTLVGFMYLEQMMAYFQDILEQTDESAEKLTVNIDRSSLATVIKGYQDTVLSMNTSNQNFIDICTELLKVHPYSMNEILIVWDHLDEGEADLMAVYTEFAELKSELEDVDKAIETLRGRYNIDEREQEETQFEDLINQVDHSKMN